MCEEGGNEGEWGRKEREWGKKKENKREIEKEISGKWKGIDEEFK